MEIKFSVFTGSVLLIFTFFGCHQVDLQSKLIEINIEENVKNVKPISVCDLNGEISYVPLETDSIFLKTAALSAFNEDYILVSDRTTCLLYGMDGNFISRIGRKGKGPGEYNFITKIQFGLHNTIYINDLSTFLVFDLTGKFLNSFKPQVNPDDAGSENNVSSFAPIDDSVFIGQIKNDSGLEKYQAVFFDKTGRTVKLVKNYCMINKIKHYSSSENGEADIYRIGGAVFFRERFNDTVFRINDHYQFEPAYHINLGKYSLPKEVRELPLRELSKKRRDYIEVHQVFETSGYFFLSSSFGNHHPVKDFENLKLPGTMPFWAWGMLGIYEKSGNELVFAKINTAGTLLTTSGLENDFDGGISFYPRNQMNDSTLSMWADAYLLKEHIASDYFRKSTPDYPEKKRELEDFVNGLSENDNPVLILCTFKTR